MFTKLPQPLEPKLVIRILIVITIVLTLTAGFYHSAFKLEQQKTKQLEIMLKEKL